MKAEDTRPLGLDPGRPITLANLVITAIQHSPLCAITASGHRCTCGAKAETA